MKTLLWSIAIAFILITSPVEAQRYCGYGRWVNGYFVCPPTTAERIETELQENRRVLREQATTLKEIERTQRAIAAKPAPKAAAAQVIVIQQPSEAVKKQVEGAGSPCCSRRHPSKSNSEWDMAFF